jgi:hypothetical protein
MLQLIGCVPADGIAAAANWPDFGTSRWQLTIESYTSFTSS